MNLDDKITNKIANYKDSFDMLDEAVTNVLGNNHSLESVSKDTCFCILLYIKKSN